MVHEYLVLPDADAAADEVDAEVAATVFVDVEALLLIRPDAYAVRHDEWAPRAALRHWLEPAKSILLEEK